MSQTLPERPDLEQLKKQAKDLLQRAREGDPQARADMPEAGLTPALHDAQKAVARRHGFATWALLKEAVEQRHRLEAPFEALSFAVRNDDVGAVTSLLAEHPDLRAKLNEAIPEGSFGSTALHVAVRRKCVPMIEALVKAGANPRQVTHWWAGGFSLLEECDPSLVPLLLSLGAEMDALAAARLGRIDELRALIAADRRVVHQRGGDGKMPLHWAATVEVARLLLDAGAEIDARDVDHESTPAQYMVGDRREVARFLVSRGCQTDLLLAAALGLREKAEEILRADPGAIRLNVSLAFFPKINPQAGGTIYIWTLGWHVTPHDLARVNKDHPMLSLLMDASPRIVRLAQACLWEDEALVDSLTQGGNAPVPTRADERTRLVDAAQANRSKAVRLLVAHGWPLDCRDSQGATALHWAAWHGNAELVLFLLELKAPVEAKDDAWSMNPLGWALHGSLRSWHRKTGQYVLVIKLLREAGARPPAYQREHDQLSAEVFAAIHPERGRGEAGGGA